MPTGPRLIPTRLPPTLGKNIVCDAYRPRPPLPLALLCPANWPRCPPEAMTVASPPSRQQRPDPSRGRRSRQPVHRALPSYVGRQKRAAYGPGETSRRAIGLSHDRSGLGVFLSRSVWRPGVVLRRGRGQEGREAGRGGGKGGWVMARVVCVCMPRARSVFEMIRRRASWHQLHIFARLRLGAGGQIRPRPCGLVRWRLMPERSAH